MPVEKYSQENILKYFFYFYWIGGKIFPREYSQILTREYSQIFLLLLLDRRQNIPKRIFSNISFTFIELEAKYSQESILKYFFYFYWIGGKIFPREYSQIFLLLLLDWRQCGISVTECALVANKEEGALVFVINNPFSPDAENILARS